MAQEPNRKTTPSEETRVASGETQAEGSPEQREDWDLTDAEWRARLTPEQYRITRQKGTERPGTGEYLHTTTAGIYRCVCCGHELFRSETKFDSHCGWPSFMSPADASGVTEVPDYSHGMVRTEVLCSRCGAHLGHVFPDGPGPNGLRYCINSVALDLEEDAMPEEAESAPNRE